MTLEPDSITKIRCIDLASTNAGDQNLYLQDTNDDAKPWKRVRRAQSTLTPVDLSPNENRFLHACTVELDGGALLMFNDEDELDVGIIKPDQS